MDIHDAIARAIGHAPAHLESLSGGCVGEVYRAEFPDRAPLVAKVDRGARGQLDVEGFMLEYLAPHLTVPAVVHAAPELLLMEFIPGGSSFDGAAEEHAADLLAQLHTVTATEFGFERDTLIGGLPQPNPWSASWVPFFAEHRVLFMARLAREKGRLSSGLHKRVEMLATRLDAVLTEPESPSLLHGDIWSGNVLAKNGRITAFLDPAVYFGHPEVELAFITMFSTFGDRFFARYSERRGIAEGFMDERRHLYNLYPYLVHVRLFGGSYAGAVERIVTRFA